MTMKIGVWAVGICLLLIIAWAAFLWLTEDNEDDRSR